MGDKPAAAVITTALSAVIGAPRARVWRALTTPAELIRWDKSILSLMEPADDFPTPEKTARWRYQLGAVSVILRDRPLEVSEGHRLRSDVSLGLFRFDQTWSLASESRAANGSPTAVTRVGLHLAAGNSIAVVGGMVDRFDVRRLAAEYMDGKLRGLRAWCEGPTEAP